MKVTDTTLFDLLLPRPVTPSERAVFVAGYAMSGSDEEATYDDEALSDDLILDALVSLGEASGPQVASTIRRHRATVTKRMKRMAREGTLLCTRPSYKVILYRLAK